MPSVGINDYFTLSGQQRALAAYASFARGTAWSVPHKLDLYEASFSAFAEAGADTTRLQAFLKIYQNLISYWQVFRPHRAEECWSAEQIFRTIQTEFVGLSREKGPTLLTLESSGQRHSIMFSLMAMEGIKPNIGYPTMTVSKFLHFYNPSLFPIYDTEVIWNRVFRRFKSDYRAYCSSSKLAPSADGAAFLRNYLCWASSLLSEAHPRFMAVFVDWLKDELPAKSLRKLPLNELKTLFATSFEFTAIGAAVAEGF